MDSVSKVMSIFTKLIVRLQKIQEREMQKMSRISDKIAKEEHKFNQAQDERNQAEKMQKKLEDFLS